MARLTQTPDTLDDDQNAALAAFVNTNVALEAARTRRVDDLADRRLEALAHARSIGVPGTTLARAAGLSHGRIYQLEDELKARQQGWESVELRKKAHVAVGYDGDWLTPDGLDEWLAGQPTNGNGR